MRLSRQLTESLVEAVTAKVGEKRERKDGYTWEKQQDGKWKRLGKTKDLKAKEEGVASAAQAVSEKDAPVPKGRIWIDHLPGMPKSTAEAHKDPQTGEYTPERKALHEEIISQFLAGTLKDSKGNVRPAKPVPPGKKPVSLFMLGTTASGKSSAREKVKPDPFGQYGAVEVDPDAVKQLLPEYKASVKASAKDAAKISHDESSYIADQIRRRALEQNKNVIVDGTGKNRDKMMAKINDAKNSKHSIQALMPHVPYEDCVQRADDRAEKTGRYVPHEIIKECADKVGKSFMSLQDQFDRFVLFDNRNRPAPPGKDFAPPVRLMSAPPRPPKVHDKERLARFKRESGIMEWVRVKGDGHLLSEASDARLGIDSSKLVQWYVDVLKAEEEHMASLPRDYKVGQGIEEVLGD